MTQKNKEIIVIALAVIAGLLAVVCYFTFDEQIVSRIVRDGADWHRFKPLRAFALLGKTWLQIWLLLIWFCAVGRVRPLLVALGTIAIVAVIVPLLKLSAHRVRPIETARTVGFDESSREDKTWYSVASFPSGDTATACGAAAALGFSVAWPWTMTLLTVGAGVGLLRVAALAHHPSDALAGAAIGLFCAWLILRATRRWTLPELLPVSICRRVAAVGSILIALPVLLSHNTQRSVLFLTGYVLPIAALYVLQKTTLRLRRPTENKDT
jgi:membrane-associated phospholipid phosphatase